MEAEDTEIVDAGTGILLRRVVVGPLRTNCWVVSSLRDEAALLVDPGGEAPRILDAVSDRRVEAIVVTHAHADHVGALAEVVDALGVPVRAHPGEEPVWPAPWRRLAKTSTALADSEVLHAGPLTATVLATPGHTPGGISLGLPGRVLAGDTLFPGGPGATGRPHSHFGTIVDSIGRVLFALPDETVVHPGHGLDTTIGAERPHLDEWIERGW